MTSLILAFQVLTRLPLPARSAPMSEIGRSIPWFPIVGAAIGLMAVGVNQVGFALFAPPVANAVIVLALVAVTGAFHLDGLIDTVDGLAMGPDAAARLAAMRQHVAGSSGALAGCGMVFLTFAAISGLPDNARVPALIVAPIAGRSAILLGYTLFPYGRPEPGLSQALKDGATPARAALGLAGGLGIALGVAHLAGVALVVGALVGGALLGVLATRRLPGLTGDVHGAICEVSQLGVLLVAPAVIR